ncbi:sperm-tail PG-rich repeat-containing protein 2 isoform X2 [Homo sapiens]|uniref:sperm-tail PG-rich repeat-containing protein 2 isoform X2 n=1 Tax=Homo sapiens TaxID=9606 RepID=UPI0023DFEE81|nr:sperm-tail PG-rich repeat-containing protein 2 isoform X2 [Homo sapiens]
MYDRAPRLLKLAEGGSTEAHVGPGSYQVPFLKQQATGSNAPFLSLTARESTFTIASSIEKAVPGPGHYNVSEAQCNIKGGHSLQNREKRFKKFISDNPGPASYDQFYPRTQDIMNRKVLETREHLQSKISRSPTLTRSVDVPSIPSCGKSYGYHINDDGSIIKCFPPACDSTLGPAYHKPQFGVPGPGKYDIKSQFQKIESMTPNANDASPAFLSQSQRFLPMKSITPAPGTYNEPRTALKSLKKTSGLKNIPFGQSAVRFTQDIRTEEMPGPGFYNVLNNTIIASVRNICSKKQKKSAFGSSVPRTFFSVQKEACATPGPADYQEFWHSQGVGISDELPNLTNKYAAFLSRAKRTMKVPDMVIPAPGSYDVHKSYEMSQVKHKYMPPRSLVAKRKHASFLSATPRCLEKVTDGPGPAAYNPVLRKSCPIPLFVKASKRFEESKEITPGPATYELSPFLRHTVLKRTFNVTLPNSFLIDREITPTLEQKAKQKHQGGKI